MREWSLGGASSCQHQPRMPAWLKQHPGESRPARGPDLADAVSVYLHTDYPDEQIHLLPALAAAGVKDHELVELATSCAAWSSKVGWWTPTISHKAPGLAGQWSEWMMGHPCGWTTEVLPRRRALKVVGASVVPQQAANLGAYNFTMWGSAAWVGCV